MKKLVILLIILFLYTSLVFSQLKITEVNGRVQALLVSKGDKKWKNVLESMILSDSDKIRTARDSSFVLRSDNYEITILDRSIVIFDKIIKLGDAHTEIYILKGRIRIKSSSLAHDENIIIRSKNSEVIPVGTDFVSDFSGVNDTFVYVFNGKARAVNPNSPDNPVEIDAYKMSKISGINAPETPVDIPQDILEMYKVAPRPQVIQPTVIKPEKVMKEPAVEPEPVAEPEEKLPLEPEPDQPEKPKAQPQKPAEKPKEEPKKEPDKAPEKDEP